MKLDQVRKFALSLPEVTEEPHFQYTSFRVRGKIFLTAPPGERYIHVFVDFEAREPALELHPDFVEKLMWGTRVAGLRVTLAGAKPGVVHELVLVAWRRKAPKGLAATLVQP
jgi:hypothetical protein